MEKKDKNRRESGSSSESDNTRRDSGSYLMFLKKKSVNLVSKIGTKMSAKPNVYVTRNVPSEAIQLLQSKCHVKQWLSDDPVPRDVLLKESETVDGLFCLLTDKIDAELLNKAKNLKVVGTMSVGYEHIDVQECRKRNLLLGYTPDVLTEATAELTVALLLATSRRLIEANKAVYDGSWGAWKPLWMCGPGLHGSVVGIIGLGRIGLSIAKKLKPFLPKEIIYYNRKVSDAATEIDAKLVHFDQLLTLSDFVIVCCQLNDETRHLINEDALNKMKPNAILINMSRGGVVDQEALYGALKEKKILAAGLDVCTPEPLPVTDKLLQLENLVMLPHIGSATINSRTQMAMLTAENIIAGLSNHPLPAAIP